MPDKQQEMVKKLQSLGFVMMGKAKNGNIFMELRGNDPIRASIAPDGAVSQLSGDVGKFDWLKLGKP